MKLRAAYCGGIGALCVIGAIVVLSRLGFKECGEWVVSTAVAFFTHEEVSPEHGGITDPIPARASETRKRPEKDARNGSSSGSGTAGAGSERIELAKVENKKALAEKGFAVVSGRIDGLIEAEDAPAAAEPVEAPEARTVQETEGQIVDTLGGFVAPARQNPAAGAPAEGGTRAGAASGPPAPPAPEVTNAVVDDRSGHNPLRSKYAYNSYGERDPFRPLIGDGSESEEKSDKLNLDGARLVGILWGRTTMALLEDDAGLSFCLEKGDRVQDGRLVEIRSNTVVFNRYRFGGSETVVLELAKKKAGGL